MNNREEIQLIFIDDISYRTQFALYEILHEQDEELTWKEFVELVASYPTIRRAASETALYALTAYDFSQIDFENAEIPDEPPRVADEMAVLFGDQMGRELVKMFLYKAADEHYRRMRATREGYNREMYAHDLFSNNEMERTLLRAYAVGLSNVDFRGAWLRDGLEPIAVMLDSCHAIERA